MHTAAPLREQSCYARGNRFNFPQKLPGLLHVCVECVPAGKSHAFQDWAASVTSIYML